MENSLYPLKFMPLLKPRIWGGKKLQTHLGIDTGVIENCGEAWMLSAVEDNESVVANGFLEGNTLSEVIEIYMDDLVGEKTYEQFGVEFPLLIKFIDANDKLSIQVHPDNELAQKRDLPGGKTEMWYIIDAEPEASLINGFKEKVSRNAYLENLKKKTLPNLLNEEKATKGDVFFIPAGRVHALGAGLLLAEIQQTSDTTYRIYDWERVDNEGKSRQLHTEQALDAIDFSKTIDTKTPYEKELNKTIQVVNSEYFITNILEMEAQSITKDLSALDSFVIYICVEGSCSLETLGTEVNLKAGEVVLIPAIAESLKIKASKNVKLLEVYI